MKFTWEQLDQIIHNEVCGETLISEDGLEKIAELLNAHLKEWLDGTTVIYFNDDETMSYSGKFEVSTKQGPRSVGGGTGMSDNKHLGSSFTEHMLKEHEAMAAEIVRLREALEFYAKLTFSYDLKMTKHLGEDDFVKIDFGEIARAALKGRNGNDQSKVPVV